MACKKKGCSTLLPCSKCLTKQLANDGRRKGSGGGNRFRDITLQTGAAAIGVTGYMANPGQMPNTDQLGDVNDSQMERNRDAIEDKSHEQGTGTSQY